MPASTVHTGVHTTTSNECRIENDENTTAISNGILFLQCFETLASWQHRALITTLPVLDCQRATFAASASLSDAL